MPELATVVALLQLARAREREALAKVLIDAGACG